MDTAETKKRVVIAMSGGVDSSVSAALLKDQGYDVIGVTMQLWDKSKFTAADGKKFGTCCSLDDVYDARRVAEHLGIPFYVINFEDEFQKYVIDDFVSEYCAGNTPNPCVKCNQWLKFALLMKKARDLGADFLATGHYAWCEKQEDGRHHLLMGSDANKDQSYFLFTLTQEQLASTLFPLGRMTKGDVRQLAEKYQLRVAEKKESQEICFVPDNDYVRFLHDEGKALPAPGNIVDATGTVLGRHDGIYRYTIGQRKGLGLSHPTPLFVLRVDAEKNEVIVGDEKELFVNHLRARHINWIAPAPQGEINATCKIRYRHAPVACKIVPGADGGADVFFAKSERAVTPGQAVVFYRDNEVLGGGWIAR